MMKAKLRETGLTEHDLLFNFVFNWKWLLKKLIKNTEFAAIASLKIPVVIRALKSSIVLRVSFRLSKYGPRILRSGKCAG